MTGFVASVFAKDQEEQWRGLEPGKTVFPFFEIPQSFRFSVETSDVIVGEGIRAVGGF